MLSFILASSLITLPINSDFVITTKLGSERNGTFKSSVRITYGKRLFIQSKIANKIMEEDALPKITISVGLNF